MNQSPDYIQRVISAIQAAQFDILQSIIMEDWLDRRDYQRLNKVYDSMQIAIHRIRERSL